MKISTITLLATLLISQHGLVYASGSKLSPSYDKCIAKAGAADPAILDCINKEYDLQDRRLNASYKTLMAKLNSSRKAQLQEAQRLWLKFIEANCGFYHDSDGGSVALMMAAQCSVDARAQRANELEDFVKSN